MTGFPPPLFLTCTTRPSGALCLPLPAHFPFLVVIGSPIILPWFFFFPRRVDLLIPLIDREEGQTSLFVASPSILVALWICCNARNSAHVGNLYPASSNSSVHLVSLQIVAISACSWPFPTLLLFQKVPSPASDCPSSSWVIRKSHEYVYVA